MLIHGSKSNKSSASIVDSGWATVVSRLTEVNLSTKACRVDTVPPVANANTLRCKAWATNVNLISSVILVKVEPALF